MLIYIKKNFTNYNTNKILLSNNLWKSIVLNNFFHIPFNLLIMKIKLTTNIIYSYFSFLNIFFRNNFIIYTKMIKKLIKKYSHNCFITNNSSYFIKNIKQNSTVCTINLKNNYFLLKIIKIRKFNILNFNNFFKFLTYIIPLKLINYLYLINQSFGFNKNFTFDMTYLFFSIKNNRYIFKLYM